MFERYTEEARRIIFHARFEASRFGGEHIDTEHLLLGMLRAGTAITLLFPLGKAESIRDQIEKQFPRREKIAASVDLPVSPECKRVLAYGAEEAERRNHKHIAPQHLVLGLLRERNCLASKILLENGVTPTVLEQALLSEAGPETPEAAPSSSNDYRDLTAEALDGTTGPLIGRERELEHVIRILSRRTRNNAVLIGEPGVGKSAIVRGLARRIADGRVPEDLAERAVLFINAGSLISPAKISPGKAKELPAIGARREPILYVQGLFDMAGKAAGWGALELLHGIERRLAGEGLQCIASGTPSGLRLTNDRAGSLARLFEVVPVPPPDDEEAIRIVAGVKEQYEKFHSVVITNEAIETAVAASRWFIRYRQLPDRAIDLIDDAAAQVKLRCEKEPPEIVQVRKRLRLIVREIEKAIANHAFSKASGWGQVELKERENLERLRAELKQNEPANIVNAADVLEAIAARAGLPVSAVANVLRDKPMDRLETAARELTAQLPLGNREWAEGLVTYLAGCSAEEADKLALAIRAANARLTSGNRPSDC